MIPKIVRECILQKIQEKVTKIGEKKLKLKKLIKKFFWGLRKQVFKDF